MSDHGIEETDESRIERRQVDQDRTLAAMQELEAALALPAPGREASWRAAILAALGILQEATTREAENANRPDSLLADLAATQPHLRNRVRGLRLQYRQLRETIGLLLDEVAQDERSPIDFADFRQRATWVITGLRHQRAKESDLIYEAYYDAFKSDLPRDADRDLGAT